MQTETRTFRITLVSPLHIGCGEVYEPTSFVVKEQKKSLVSFNPFLFLQQLPEEKRREFSKICKEGTVQSLVDVYKFINREAQNVSGVSVAVGEDFIKHYRSILELERKSIGRKLNQFSIGRTAFNPVEDLPYIPGSTVKGSLRTAVLNKRFRAGKKMLPREQEKQNEQLQEELLGGSFSSDPFSRVKVSDFHPVSEVKRAVCYAVNIKKKPKDRAVSSVYQIVEIVEPGAVFQGMISVSEASSKHISTPVSFDEIEQALDFFGGEWTRETSEIKEIGVMPGPSPVGQGLPLRLGRHSGAECVTSVDEKRQIKIIGKPRPLNYATTIWFSSHKKKPRNLAQLHPFGWVSLSQVNEADRVAGEAFQIRQSEQLKVEREKQRLHLVEEKKRIEEERRAREEAASEKQRQEQEDRQFPWKPWLRQLQSDDASRWNWGELNRILSREDIHGWRNQEGVAAAVHKAAECTYNNAPKKWSEERDCLVRDWLKETDSSWESKIKQAQPEEQLSPKVVQIQAMESLDTYTAGSLKLEDLSLTEARELRVKFKEWGCDKGSAKKEKKMLWKALNRRIRKLKESA